jgi:hypothetical protein
LIATKPLTEAVGVLACHRGFVAYQSNGWRSAMLLNNNEDKNRIPSRWQRSMDANRFVRWRVKPVIYGVLGAIALVAGLIHRACGHG